MPTPSAEYLSKNVPSGSKIGMDPTLIAADDCVTLSTSLAAVSSSLVSIPQNLVDELWTEGRPAQPSAPIFALPVSYAGSAPSEKVSAVRAELARKGAWAKGYVASMLDEVAWLFNLRGSDVPYNPVFFAFALVLKDETRIYVHEKNLEDEARAQLQKDATVRPYEAFYDDLKEVGGKLAEGEKVRLPSAPGRQQLLTCAHRSSWASGHRRRCLMRLAARRAHASTAASSWTSRASRTRRSSRASALRTCVMAPRWRRTLHGSRRRWRAARRSTRRAAPTSSRRAAGSWSTSAA